MIISEWKTKRKRKDDQMDLFFNRNSLESDFKFSSE